MLKKPEAIIFDWDNTLVDSLPAVDEAREATFEKFKSYGTADIQLMNTCASKKSFFSQFAEKENDAIDFFLLTYGIITKDGVVPLDGAAAALQLIADANIPIIIVSNKLNTLLNREIELLGWGKYFDKIIGSKDTPHDKPHPDPVHIALESIGRKASPEVWLIGDSTVDIQCALTTTCYPILFGDKAEFDESQFPGHDIHHIENHHNLITLLSSIV